MEVLHWIREESSVRKLPVVILSASEQKSDVDRCYEFGANAFLVKPSDADGLADMCRALKHFWLTYNIFPPECVEAPKPIQ